MNETEIVPAPSSAITTELRAAAEAAIDAANHDRAKNTKRAYKKDWEQFEAWAKAAGLQTLPATPSTVGLWLGQLIHDGLKPSTVARKLSAISVKHREADLDSPRNVRSVRKILNGYQKKHGIRQRQAAPVLEADLLRASRAAGKDPDDLKEARNRALLLVGWIGAFRRSELVALEVEDLAWVEEGAIATVRRSKTDQKGEGHEKVLYFSENPELCPAKALQHWLKLAGIVRGLIFRKITAEGAVDIEPLHPEAARRIVLKLAGNGFTTHSLRAGFVTEAALQGRTEAEIMRQTGHRSPAMVRRYTRIQRATQGNAAKGLL